MEPVYRYRAVLKRVIDGDTFELDVDLGFKVHAHLTIRLRGIDCPERNTPEGILARLATVDLLTGKPLVIETYKDQQTFARWVATVWVNGESLADRLRVLGHVKVIELPVL